MDDILKYNIFDLEKSFTLNCRFCRRKIGSKTLGNMFDHLYEKHPDKLKDLLLFEPEV